MGTSISMYLLVALISALISYLGLRFIKDKQIEKSATTLATVLTKLDNIIADVKEIKVDLKDQKKWNNEFTERLAKVEESAKQAHKRISELKEAV